MTTGKLDELFASYCYGPADLTRICQGDSTMWLFLRDCAGRRAEAIYRGCVYWQLEPEQVGMHLSLVQRVSAGQLLQNRDSILLRLLKKNSSHVEKLLQEWEAAGLSFFLHLGRQPDLEFLVVAEQLQYRELDRL